MQSMCVIFPQHVMNTFVIFTLYGILLLRLLKQTHRRQLLVKSIRQPPPKYKYQIFSFIGAGDSIMRPPKYRTLEMCHHVTNWDYLSNSPSAAFIQRRTKRSSYRVREKYQHHTICQKFAARQVYIHTKVFAIVKERCGIHLVLIPTEVKTPQASPFPIATTADI